jgi:hypothetical protein
MPTIPKQLKIGQFEIPETCTVPWEEMDAHPSGNRMCRQCNKVVHDLTGMSEAEIEALFERNGGSLCGNFSLDELGNPIYFRNELQPRKPKYLKHLAAAASLILLYQTPHAGGGSTTSGPRNDVTWNLEGPVKSNKNASTITPENNTLVSGVILTPDSIEIHDSLKVQIYANGKWVRNLKSQGGFFSTDFEGKLKPTDKIKIVVVGHAFDTNLKYESRKYGGASMETTLGHAQNVQMVVAYTPPIGYRKTGGVMVRSFDR